jgi:MFS family permease
MGCGATRVQPTGPVCCWAPRRDAHPWRRDSLCLLTPNWQSRLPGYRYDGVASLLALSFVQSLPAFYIAHVVYGGFGFSVLYSPLLSTTGEWFPERRGLVMGLVTAGGALGQGLLPFFASSLINAFGWRWALVGLGCTHLAALGLTLPLLRWPQRTRTCGHCQGSRDDPY